MKGGQIDSSTSAVIINLIALLAVRHPEMRSQMDDFWADVMKKTSATILATEERWESHLRRMREDGVGIPENVPYEQLKDFVERGEYEIIFPTESHINTEFHTIDGVLPFLFERDWIILTASEDAGPFITCDTPVSLMWIHPENVPPMYRQSPGFAMPDTSVLFPVSRSMAMFGVFGGGTRVVPASRELVSVMNTRILSFAVSQIYGPDLSFGFFDANANLREGRDMLDLW